MWNFKWLLSLVTNGWVAQPWSFKPISPPCSLGDASVIVN